MSKITSSLLTDTLNVIALARETALARGGQEQAERLTPVVNGLREVASARDAQMAAPSGLLAQEGFQALLAAAQAAPLQGPNPAAGVDKGQVAAAMSAGGMVEVYIARHLGVTREEVRLMLASRDAGRSPTGVSAALARGRYQS